MFYAQVKSMGVYKIEKCYLNILFLQKNKINYRKYA